MHYIYGLLDPRNGHLRYIGRTVDPQTRYKSHCMANQGSERKNDWIQELRDKSLLPEMCELDTADDQTVEEVEKFYISYFRMLGAKLTNDNGKRPNNKVYIDNRKPMPVYIKPELKDKIAKAAEEMGVSQSTWLNIAAMEKLARDK